MTKKTQKSEKVKVRYSDFEEKQRENKKVVTIENIKI